MSDDDALNRENQAVDNLKRSNTPENRKAFQDAHKAVAEREMDKTRRRLHQHYRDQARRADAPQVDKENPQDYKRDILDND